MKPTCCVKLSEEPISQIDVSKNRMDLVGVDYTVSVTIVDVEMARAGLNTNMKKFHWLERSR